MFVPAVALLALGVAAVVFLTERYRTRDLSRGLRAAAFTAVGVLGSAAVQLLVTLSMLAGFLLAGFLLAGFLLAGFLLAV